MSKQFRAWKIDDVQLLPLSVQDYVAEDDFAADDGAFAAWLRERASTRRGGPRGLRRRRPTGRSRGQIKQARGFRQFLLRGIEKVKAEWALICIAHNLVKLARAT